MEASKEIYRVAFETANAELAAINAECDRLRVRKEQVEKLVAVLLVLFGEEHNSANASRGTPSESNKIGLADQASNANAEPQAVLSDPFQRRIDHVLGIGAGIRDVRKYNRQF